MANKPEKKQLQNWITIGFIVLSCSVFLVLGTAPAALLVFAGAFNGLVLPIGFTLIIYVAAMRSKDLLQGYQYPKWLIAIGLAAMVVAWWLAWRSFGGVFQLLGISG